MTITANEIVTAAPGSVFLLYAPLDERESMLQRLYDEAARCRQTDSVCKADMLFVSMEKDQHDNAFSDLGMLCRKLVAYAGYASHFDGLLVVDMEKLTGAGNEDRLRALGELLLMEGGLASRCVTVICGPENEQSMLICADLIDYSGRLRPGRWKGEKPDIRSLMARAQVICENDLIRKAVQKDLDALCGSKRFDPIRYLHAACDEGRMITEQSFRRMKENPYSYYGRQMRETAAVRKPEPRRMGFGA